MAAPADSLPILHAVTTDEILRRPDFPEIARVVLATGGARIALHLRGGRTTARRLHEIGAALIDHARASGAWLVVNDRIDVALTCNAHGAQLTTRSLAVQDARAAAPAIRIGASVHTPAEARTAAAAGAHWIVAGNVFQTASHPDRDARGLEFAREIAAACDTPVIAIGGVHPEHFPLLRAAGLAGVAVIRGVWEARDAAVAVADYLSSHDHARGDRHPGNHRQW
jgi:thiamine-phosphate diphosphorylase